MAVDLALLKDQCAHTLERADFTRPGVKRIEGKVRDNYVRGDRRAIVVTDRVSTFDVVVGTIPFKGQVLNQLAAFWFERTAKVAPNHLLDVPDPAVSLVRECKVLPVEFVYRGYLTGVTNTSIWTAYSKGERKYCGHTLPDGLKKHQKLPEPLLTPTTKAEKGLHDELTSREQLIASGVISEELYDQAAALAKRLFEEGTAFAASRGLILVDTKYEMGVDKNGELVLIDEVHTPDSSRYWYLESYERTQSEGKDPEALDKEFLRRWLVEQGYRGQGAPPVIPDEVRCEAARRYIAAYELVTGLEFKPATEPPLTRIPRNLASFFA
jgi:phosphoribosylaminoimidazole-succinocarboxamide synthase